MKATDIVLAGIAGTTAFTLFSYIVSEQQKKNFKEPELLGEMLETTTPEPVKPYTAPTGWFLHYLKGTAFAASYAVMFRITGSKPTLSNGIITGAVSGVAAIAWWHTALELHPNPPRKPSAGFYGTLFVGHILFGAFSFLSFRMFRNKENRSY